MQTHLDCLVCFMRQALAAARLSTNDPKLHREVVDATGRMLAEIDLGSTPPENAVFLYRLIAKITGKADPFVDLKRQSNEFALSIRDQISDTIAGAADPLRTALRFAACGNIIDYAAQHSFDATKTMADCGSQPFVVDDYPRLLDKLEHSDQKKTKILYLADNCGELVFDGLLIRELQRLGCVVTLAVRGAPIINDATMEDVRSCGLNSLCRVIGNGTGCPGTPLGDCSDIFQQAFADADVIISKGMGNFETLSDVAAPLFFLFTVKCARVASYLHKVTGKNDQEILGSGEMVFMQQRMPVPAPG
ncbi:MAG: ARMT1-like domain-containing protein [Desulfobulbaceae bacterium]|nr:ARMT1-like domain-containing protein [Desulfobulbaceae bacterium]